jgi:hypothetical protein
MKTCTKCGGLGPFPQEMKRGKMFFRAECVACRSTRTSTQRAEKYRNRRRRIEQIKNVPCADCGKTFAPQVMDFDHRDPKTKIADVAQMIMGSWTAVTAEIAKCCVVCANCHRLRTWDPSEHSGRKRGLLRRLKEVPCADCEGSFHYSQMDFDHVRGEKKKDVSRLTGAALVVLLAEVDKCDVVCANCHRQRTHKRDLGLEVDSPAHIPILPEWATTDWRALVGTMGDGGVAALAGISRVEVFECRKRARIPSFNTHRRYVWQPLVGTMPDASVALRGGVTRSAVSQYRKRMGIPVFPSRYTRKKAA